MTTPDEIIPFLAVIKPTESTLVTSSYVNTPPIDKLFVTSTDAAVTIPVALICLTS